MASKLFITKSFSSIENEQRNSQLKRALGPWQLTALGVGGTIGTGIFVLTGLEAAVHAGPAIVISFIIAGIGCLFAGLCYAEFASMAPVSGSAYTYTYATLGEFAAWFIGWDTCSPREPWRWGGRVTSAPSSKYSASRCRRR